MKFAAILAAGSFGQKAGIVRDECRAFLVSGGSLSLEDWDAMADEGRAAFLAAGEALQIERARIAAMEGAKVTTEALQIARERRAASAALDAAEGESRR